MQHLPKILTALAWLLLLQGCASTTVTERHSYQGPKLSRPSHIYIEDFTGGSNASGGRLGALVADRLVSRLSEMGLPARLARNGGPRKVGDLVIRGRFISTEGGSETQRTVVGFGSGAAELKVAVEGYSVTAKGLQMLGSGQIQAEGDKQPGMMAGVAGLAATGNPVGLIVGGVSKATGDQSDQANLEGLARQTADKIADEMKAKFQAQGWL